MNMTSKELVRLLKKNGWYEVKQEGSHLRMRKDVIIPIHNKDVSKGLLMVILKQTGLR